MLLRERLDRHSISTWLRPIVPRGLVPSPRGPCLILEAPSPNAAAWIQQCYGQALEEALKGVAVAYVVEPPAVSDRGPPGGAASWRRATR